MGGGWVWGRGGRECKRVQQGKRASSRTSTHPPNHPPCPAPQPGISLAHQESSGTALHREYVLQPVDGRALYSRCGTGQKLEEDEPASEMDFQLDVIAVRLSSA